MTLEEMQNLTPHEQRQLFIRISKVRKKFKVVNYSGIYGIGKDKLARDTGMTVQEADELLTAYWQRNWSVKKISENIKTKVCLNSLWLLNPVSGFWYQLRFQKDVFSTLNQGTGVYVFDKWIWYYRKDGAKVIFQFHDETGNYVKRGDETLHKEVLERAIDKLNQEVNLNVPLAVDVKFGESYDAVH